MANTSQARKRARQAEKSRQHNASLRSEMRTHVKRVLKAITGSDKSLAQNEYRKATSMIDKLASKGLIHKNKAANQKSRLSNISSKVVA